MARLVAEGLRCRALGPFELSVGEGECVAISGPSGSGKTLLLRALADLDPHEGRVLLDGVACSDVAAPLWRRRVGLLRAESRWWTETAGELLGGVEPASLGRLGLDPMLLGQPVARLSSGERQRLALLRLLARRPEVLLLDEPTAHLDAPARAASEALVGGYRAQHGAAVVWVTHDEAQARRVARRRLRLEGGCLHRVPDP